MSNGKDLLARVKIDNAQAIADAHAASNGIACVAHKPVVRLGERNLQMTEMLLEHSMDQDAGPAQKEIGIGKFKIKGYDGMDVVRIVIAIGVALLIADRAVDRASRAYERTHGASSQNHGVVTSNTEAKAGTP